MDYTKEQIETMANKAAKWDALTDKVAECYEDWDAEGNEIPSKFEQQHGRTPDLGDVGLIAAGALGFDY